MALLIGGYRMTIKLSSKGGGGSIIGDVRALNVDDASGLFISSGEEWLRTGVIDDDVASYPDAKQGNNGSPYVGLPSQETDASTGLPIYVRIK